LQTALCKPVLVSVVTFFAFSLGATVFAGGPTDAQSTPFHYAGSACRSGAKRFCFRQTLGQEKTRDAIPKAEGLLQGVRKSYPELSGKDIRVHSFHSSSDYLRTRFSVRHYLTFQRMQFSLEINPLVFELGAPDEALQAIIAHELEHVLYLSRRNRIRMLSLVRLARPSFTMRFERKADLGAIGRGYGSGLILYRKWLYKNIPRDALAEKYRDYFSPEEISAIQLILRDRPEMLAYWLKHVPRNLREIRRPH
jgi:hypothetical protein